MEETEVEVENILEKITIKVELGKEMEVETETDKEFDSWIVGDTLRQKFEQIRINGYNGNSEVKKE